MNNKAHWQPAVRQTAQEAAAREAARAGDSAFNYRWEHIQAVVTTARRLATLVGADEQVVEAAAWLHDVAKGVKDAQGQDLHGSIGAERAERLLSRTDFPPDKIPAVADAIRKHVGLVTAAPVEPLEAAVLWDADKLTKLGALGIVHALALGVQREKVQDTSQVNDWLCPHDLWPQIAASMNTGPAQRASRARLAACGDFTTELCRAWAADDLVDPSQLPGYSVDAMRQDGNNGVLWSPLWHVCVALTPLERALLQTWSLHRLHYVHHNGASIFAYPLHVSRLQHTLGVLALVAHFRPEDIPLRTAALLHDVGHFPFCHSAEGVANVDHHATTRQRVTDEPICGLLRAHGLEPEALLALMAGDPPNPLRTHNGLLHLDHLDSWARQAQAAGYEEIPAHTLLRHLQLEGNNVSADRATAEYLVRLIRQGNERHYAEGDVGPAAVLAHAMTLALERGLITYETLADATDEALLAQLATTGDNEIASLIMLLRQEPWRIRVRQGTPDHTSGGQPTADALVVELHALYDAVPSLSGTGEPITRFSATARAEMAHIQQLTGTYTVTWSGTTGH